MVPTASEPPKPHKAPHLRRQSWRRRLAAAYATRAGTYRSTALAWRLAVPGVFIVAGGLFVTSAISSGGIDLRAGRYGDLSSLVQAQANEVEGLRERANALSKEIDELTAQVHNGQVSAAQAKVDALRDPAGLSAVEGPGVTVTLDDAPPEVARTADIGVDKLVVHQQDIQAVANALWSGGAEAMTIQGQRVISTTGIKCVGNSVVLHGVPYSPPYVISAIGDQASLLSSLEANPYIQIYKQYVEVYQLGYDVRIEENLEMPAYEGSLDLAYARPAGGVDDGT